MLSVRLTTEYPDPCAWLDSIRSVPDSYRGPLRFIHDDFQMEHVLVNLLRVGSPESSTGAPDSAIRRATSATCLSTAAGHSSSARSPPTTCRSTRSSLSAHSSARASELSTTSGTRSIKAETRHGTCSTLGGYSGSSNDASRGAMFLATLVEKWIAVADGLGTQTAEDAWLRERLTVLTRPACWGAWIDPGAGGGSLPNQPRVGTART
jgi:hypothetical protein